jgi:excisionase family DNA binding protein
MTDRIAYSPDEAAHLASVGRTLIFSEIKHGRLKAYKAGARTLVTEDALKAWSFAADTLHSDEGRIAHGLHAEPRNPGGVRGSGN